jgi:hypothetical protein
MAENKKLITVAEAAKVLGRSASTIYAALNASPPRLHYHDVKRRLLLRDGLETRFSRSTRPRIDKPQAKAPQPELEPLTFDEKWEIIAEKANETIDCSQWGQPPWSGQQWSVLSICIGEGVRQLQAETDEV